MAGEYREKEILEQLPEDVRQWLHDGARIALLNGTPIIGMDRRDDLNEMFAQAYERIDGMERYAQGLRGGRMVVITKRVQPDRYFRSGELFFRS